MKRKIIRIIVFLLILAALSGGLSFLLRRYWNFRDDGAATSISKGFYEEKENSLDVLYLGASTVRNGISPLYMWEKYGITGYVRASAQQSVLCSYYLLKETLEYQDIKVVVMDATPLLQNTGNDWEDLDAQEPRLHEVTDYMKMSKVKLQLINSIVVNSADISYLSMISPLYRYHDRWSELGQDDFVYMTTGEYYPYKGQYPAYTTYVTTYVDDYMQEGIDDPFAAVNDLALERFEEIVSLCNERDIKLVLLKTPLSDWSYEKNELLENIASELGIPFLDYNLPELREEIGFDEKTDFADTSAHLNIYGANKMCQHLGKFLVENYSIADRSGSAEYDDWNSAYEYYKELEKVCELTKETNFVEYLKKANNSNYIVAITGRYDLASKFNTDILSAMNELGLQEDLTYYPFSSYIALISDGTVITEKVDKENLSEFYSVGGLEISLTSGGKNVPGNISSIIINGEEESLNGAGFNVVVYDKFLGQVVSSKTFNTGKNGKDYYSQK